MSREYIAGDLPNAIAVPIRVGVRYAVSIRVPSLAGPES